MDSDLTFEPYVQVVQNQNLWFVDTDSISCKLVYCLHVSPLGCNEIVTMFMIIPGILFSSLPLFKGWD